MILLDTAVLVYAIGDAHRFREPCREVFAAIAAGELVATTTVDVVQEFTHVRARRSGRSDAVGHARDFAGVLAPLLRPTEGDLDTALALYAKHERLGAFDALLAATALNSAHVTGLMSADRAFADVPSLGFVDPVDWYATRSNGDTDGA